MENAEEIFHFLEDFSKRKPKTIPQELNEYLAYVARTGDPVYQWPLVKSLFKEKLLSVITEFYETTPGVEIPPYPNVDPFNYDIMKNSLLERLDSFSSAPFTVQRICELLTFPRKQYNRIDKFMRAIEKNILVVSTREPGTQRHPEENGETNEPIVNGSDNNSEYNVDVEMEDMSWKENNGQQLQSEPQPSSSDIHITVDDIEARLKAKEEAPSNAQEKSSTQYESVTPPELNVMDEASDTKLTESSSTETSSSPEKETSDTVTEISKAVPDEDTKVDVEMKSDVPSTLVIPEIKIDDVDMTEMKLIEQQSKTEQLTENVETETTSTDAKLVTELPQAIDESSSDSKEEPDNKLSEILTSSEESSSSSDNTDGSSSSPKTDEGHVDIQEESNQSDANTDSTDKDKVTEEPAPALEVESTPSKIESDNYSISDVNSELPQPPVDTDTNEKVEAPKEEKEVLETAETFHKEEKSDSIEISSEKKE